MSSIEVSGLTKGFGGNNAVSELDMRVDAGTLVTLLGPSGCGKTTTLRCIAGLEKPDAGRITIGDLVVTDIVGETVLPPEKRGLGMVFQSYALWPHLTVQQNVAMPLKLRKMNPKDIEERVSEVLESTRLAGLAGRLPSQLSGGQQQRVAVARAIVYRPKVLLLDEPLSNLDAKLRREMRSEIRDLQHKLGITMLYVTHDQDEALSISDVVCVMAKGKIIQRGTPKEIYDWPERSFAASFLGFQNLLEAVVEAASSDGTGMFDVDASLKDGTKVRAKSQSPRAAGDKVLVAIREENVEISLKVPREEGFLKGKLKEVRYAGSRQELEVELGGNLVRSSASAHVKFERGQEVYVRLSPSESLVIEE